MSEEIEIPDITIGYVIGVDVKGGLAFKVITDSKEENPSHLWTLLGITQVAKELIQGLVDEALSINTPSLKKTYVDLSRAQLEAYKQFSGIQLQTIEAMLRKLLKESSREVSNGTNLLTP